MSALLYQQRRFSAGLAAALALTLVCCSSLLAPAQNVAEPERLLLAANETDLWLAAVGVDESILHHRGVSGSFESFTPFKAAFARLAPTSERLYAFLEGGRLHVLTAGGWQRGRDLPSGGVPTSLAVVGQTLYGLIPTANVRTSPDAEGASSMLPDTAPLTLLRYDYPQWTVVAACPHGAVPMDDAALAPRLVTLQDTLHMVWLSADGVLRVSALDSSSETPTWAEAQGLPALAGLRAFWFCAVSDLPTVVLLSSNGAASESIQLFRQLGVGGQVATWRAADLRLSELPPDVAAEHIDDVVAFNQHLVLLVQGSDGAAYLQFGRANEPPTESTVAVADIRSGRLDRNRGPTWVQTGAMLTLLGVLLMLVLFRRPAMTDDAQLPQGVATALAIQRLVGFGIDFVPFMIVAGMLLHVDIESGVRELFAWAAGGNPSSGAFPAVATLTWWAIATGMYSVYSLVMELITRRTIGKVLTGTRVVGEQHVEPTVFQVIARNVLRFIELLPVLWVLGFLVVLSRNRQRAGDIFARTLVVRGVPDESEVSKEPEGDEQNTDGE